MSQQINLFNPVFLKTKKVFSARAMSQALGVLLAGVLTVAFYARQQVALLQREADGGHAQLAQREARLARVKTDFSPRQKSAELEGELAQADAQLKAMQSVAAVLERGELGDTHGYSEYFKALARQNMNGLWLTGVSIGGAGNELAVQGRALDPALVPAYIGRLTNEQVLRGKAFGSLRISQPNAGKEAAQFVEFILESNQPEAAR